MKTSKNEMTVLYVLLACMAVYAFYSFLLSPRISENRDLNERITAEETSVRNIYNAMYGYEDNKNQFLKDKKRILAQSERFYSKDTPQEEYLNLIDEIFGKGELKIVSISASGSTVAGSEDFAGVRSPYAVYSEELAGMYGNAGASLEGIFSAAGSYSSIPVIEKTVIEIEYEGDYENIKTAAEYLEKNDKYVICSDMSIEKELPGDGQEGYTNADLNAKLVFPHFYHLSSLDTELEILDDVDCIMPMELASGEYRNMHSRDNIRYVIEKRILGKQGNK